MPSPSDVETGGSLTELSVVVPAFNESARLGPSLDLICEYLSADQYSWELIVVDDGSTDGTAGIARLAAALDPRVRLVQLPRNRGKGHAVRAGVLASAGQLVLMTDADLSTPISELKVLVNAMTPGLAGAIGSRAMAMSVIEARQSRVRESLGRMGNRVIRRVAVPGITDTQCGFKLFDGEKARTLFGSATVDGWGFDIEILHLCHRFGWPVAEVPVRWAHADGSRLGPGAYGRVLLEVLQIRRRHRRTRLAATVIRPRPVDLAETLGLDPSPEFLA